MAPMLADSPEAEATTAASTKPTLYVIDPLHPGAIEHARTLFNVVLPSDPDFAGWQKKAKAVFVRGSYFRAEDVAKCPHLLAIGKQGVGIDKIDKAACDARGIRICNAPGANAQAVAEVVVALVLAVARNIASIVVRQLTGPVPKESCSGVTIHGKTLGVIGMGHIGRRTAHILQAGFAMNVIAYDPYMPADAWQGEIRHKRAGTYQELLAEADVVSIHVPLNAETRDMITYKELQTMKRTAILVNAARGGIVNEADLQRALEEGLLWGAGLDAHEEEPPTAARYGALWKLPNVVSTPHIGATTSEAQLASASAAVDNLYAYLKGIGQVP